MPLTTAGLKIGHATDTENRTGCTVFLCPPETVGGVEIRGMGPASREIALLDPIKSVPHVHAIMLSGGSAYGLATADGVMKYLSERNIGHPTPVKVVPIVPTAAIYDLFMNGGERQPDSAMGYAACEAADAQGTTPPEQGCIGAGAGATVGKWAGFPHFMKGGFGMASMTIDGVDVFAAAVANPIGDVLNDNGTVLAGAVDRETGKWMAAKDPLRRFPARRPVNLTNTTLVVVATTAKLTKVETNRLAQRAHDGYSIALKPVHSMHDGDTAFALSTGNHENLTFDTIANMAVEVTAEAIRNAARFATTTLDMPGLGDQ